MQATRKITVSMTPKRDVGLHKDPRTKRQESAPAEKPSAAPLRFLNLDDLPSCLLPPIGLEFAKPPSMCPLLQMLPLPSVKRHLPSPDCSLFRP